MARPKKLEGIKEIKEFKCSLCSIYWSTYLEDKTECANSKAGDGIHNFDFANPIGDTELILQS